MAGRALNRWAEGADMTHTPLWRPLWLPELESLNPPPLLPGDPAPAGVEVLYDGPSVSLKARRRARWPRRDSGRHPGRAAGAAATVGGAMDDPMTAVADRLRAQRWHDTHHGSCEGGGYSSCWCCCTLCDPDWVPARPNPFWRGERGAADAPQGGH